MEDESELTRPLIEDDVDIEVQVDASKPIIIESHGKGIVIKLEKFDKTTRERVIAWVKNPANFGKLRSLTWLGIVGASIATDKVFGLTEDRNVIDLLLAQVVVALLRTYKNPICNHPLITPIVSTLAAVGFGAIDDPMYDKYGVSFGLSFVSALTALTLLAEKPIQLIRLGLQATTKKEKKSNVQLDESLSMHTESMHTDDSEEDEPIRETVLLGIGR